MSLIYRQIDNEKINQQDRDRRIQLLSDDYDVAAYKLRSMPVGTIDWRMQRKEVVALDEELRQLRLERMSHD